MIVGTKMKQIQNELAELCEIALGAKDESGEHYGRGMRANAMSNELNKLQQQEEDTVYEDEFNYVLSARYRTRIIESCRRT